MTQILHTNRDRLKLTRIYGIYSVQGMSVCRTSQSIGSVQCSTLLNIGDADVPSAHVDLSNP